MASWFLAYKCLDTKYGVARYALLIVIRSMIQGVCMVGGLHDLGKRALVIWASREVTPLFHAWTSILTMLHEQGKPSRNKGPALCRWRLWEIKLKSCLQYSYGCGRA